jgi:excinuclease ABC subunit C
VEDSIKQFLKVTPTDPGIYKMLDNQGTVLYVGKAKNLKKRINSYFQKDQDAKTSAFLRQVEKIEIIIVKNEAEALLLENNLIKSLKPKYNILFKDDKSYPYLYLSSHDFPSLTIHRGPKKEIGTYFGPFPNTFALRNILELLQKTFKLRQCGVHFFKNRSRPCIQHQIKRCSAPCVGLINKDDYHHAVNLIKLFLEGKSDQVRQKIDTLMNQASKNLEYEKAAYYRDQIRNLQTLQTSQTIVGKTRDLDLVTVFGEFPSVGINVLFIRKGLLLGSKNFLPQMLNWSSNTEILSTFLSQYYFDSPELDYPSEVVINCSLENQKLLADELSKKIARKILITTRTAGIYQKWQQTAITNLTHALKIKEHENLKPKFEALKNTFSLESIPEQITCFDVSHTGGEEAIASAVVFNQRGPLKSEYRKYNIHVTPGDDYGALREAITRHFKGLKEKKKKYPDLLLIDGGKGQLKIAAQVLEELQIKHANLFSVAKNRGQDLPEKIYRAEIAGATNLVKNSPSLLLIDQIRDEAHRFAITSHRKKLRLKRSKSVLEQITGVGCKRRTLLLSHCGGLEGIKSATVEQLSKVPSINKKLAKKIHDYLHR